MRYALLLVLMGLLIFTDSKNTNKNKIIIIFYNFQDTVSMLRDETNIMFYYHINII